MIDYNLVRKAKLSGHEVADILGVTRACLYKWRKGKSSPSEVNEARIHAFNTKLEARLNDGALPLDDTAFRRRMYDQRLAVLRKALS